MSNNSFTPQEIEQFLQQFFDVDGARQYIGARYVPIFGRAGSDTVEWDDLAPYEPLTVVMHDGVSYVSRRYVPAGIEISDTAYWVETYRFNAQVEQYRQEVLGFREDLDEFKDVVEADFVPFPIPALSKYGSLGQVLTTLEDGTTKWEDPVTPSDAQAEAIITQWLNDHPEATTTVLDGAITTAKLASGAVTPEKLANTIPGYRGALASNTDLNNTLDSGWYSITGTVYPTLLHTPADVVAQSATLLNLRGGYNAATMVTQYIIIQGSGGFIDTHVRLMNASTGQPALPALDWRAISTKISSTINDNEHEVPTSHAIYEALFNSSVPSYQGAVASNADLNTTLTSGWYAIPANVMPTLSHTPDGVTNGSGTLINIDGGYSGNTKATQLLIRQVSTTYEIYWRLMRTNTQVPESGYDWQILVDERTPTYRHNISTNTDLGTVVKSGWYAIPSATLQTLTGIPESVTSGTAALINVPGGYNADRMITQYFINQNGGEINTYVRLLDSNTGQPVLPSLDWRLVSAEVTDEIINSSTQVASSKAVYVLANAVQGYKGKNVVAFGDSRTAFDGHPYPANCKPQWAGQISIGYQQTVQRIIGSNAITNEGVSGNVTTDIATRMKAFNFTGYSALIINAGVNDFVKSSQVTIGTLQPIGSTFDTTTVYGALQDAIEHIQATYPSLKIYILVPAIAWVGGNVFPYATAEVQKNVAELYNIPYLDLYKKAGITEINRSYFFADDPEQTNQWYLHFNDYGNEWLGNMIGKFMNAN